MNAEIFTLCDYAADYGQGKLNVLGTFDTINAPVFPFSLPQCAIAMRLRIGNHESGDHTFEVRLLDSNGKKLIEPLKGQMNVLPNQFADYSTLNIPANIGGLTFVKPGKYAVELYWDDEFVSGLAINVIHTAIPIQKAA